MVQYHQRRRSSRKVNKHPDEIRIGACADYLIGKMKIDAIEEKWGIKRCNILYWIKKAGCFKLRYNHRVKGRSP
jgi:transposase-like protein